MIRIRTCALLAMMTLAASLAASAATAEEETTHSGKFEAAFSSFTGKASLVGHWRIVEEDGARFLELGRDFRAKEAPDLKLFLSPRAARDIKGNNATDGSVHLGLLESNEGYQRYAIPENTELGRYGTLIVHCEQYSKLWGTSALHGPGLH